MPRIRKSRPHPIATRAQMFRAISVGAAFALLLAWALRDVPAGAAPAAPPQIFAEQ
jgi:hypothetical protein